VHKRVIIVPIMLLMISGCAWSAYWDFRERRRLADECEETYGSENTQCAELRAQADRARTRYENDSRVTDGCGPNARGRDCPDPL
jgi:hypothetical protein